MLGPKVANDGGGLGYGGLVEVRLALDLEGLEGGGVGDEAAADLEIFDGGAIEF